MKKILITGANSYIGNSVEKWLKNSKNDYNVDTLDMEDTAWRRCDFSSYDVVYHVAGIAHADVGQVTEETKAFYYKINTDLAIETAEKAKKEGVKQFIFMSSMIIYGESARFGHMKMIKRETSPNPANFYGDSKWQADKKIQMLADDRYKVVIVRPPMIYGKGSKGNYPALSKLARKLPVFPDIKNQRSMLHIDNLCEFIRLMIDNEETGIFFPQNQEYVETSNMVELIAQSTGNKLIKTKIVNPIVWIAAYIPGKIRKLVNKAFGNMVYDKEISEYSKGEYRVVNFEESIKRTE